MVENQIDALHDAGLLSTPAPEPMRTTYEDTDSWRDCGDDAPCIHEMARSYLDSNCAHCHAADGEAEETNLWLDYFNMDPVEPTNKDFTSWGVCKTPTSAGNVGNCPEGAINDIVPGNPDYSIMLCRIDSVDPGEMMAPIGRTLIHDEGYELIRRWIEVLPELYPELDGACPPIIPE